MCGSDVDRHIEAFQPYLDAGFDEIYVANMGPNYKAMIRAYGEQVLPAVARIVTNGRAVPVWPKPAPG